jgi:hypothetical protein
MVDYARAFHSDSIHILVALYAALVFFPKPAIIEILA